MAYETFLRFTTGGAGVVASPSGALKSSGSKLDGPAVEFDCRSSITAKFDG